MSEMLGLTAPAVRAWDLVPAEHCLTVERLSGVSRYELRHDVYGRPTDATLGDSLLDLRLLLGTRALADLMGLTVDDILSWDRVPPELVLKVEKATGMSRHRLRPDVFGREPDPDNGEPEGTPAAEAA